MSAKHVPCTRRWPVPVGGRRRPLTPAAPGPPIRFPPSPGADARLSLPQGAPTRRLPVNRRRQVIRRQGVVVRWSGARQQYSPSGRSLRWNDRKPGGRWSGRQGRGRRYSPSGRFGTRPTVRGRQARRCSGSQVQASGVRSQPPTPGEDPRPGPCLRLGRDPGRFLGRSQGSAQGSSQGRAWARAQRRAPGKFPGSVRSLTSCHPDLDLTT